MEQGRHSPFSLRKPAAQNRQVVGLQIMQSLLQAAQAFDTTLSPGRHSLQVLAAEQVTQLGEQAVQVVAAKKNDTLQLKQSLTAGPKHV